MPSLDFMPVFAPVVRAGVKNTTIRRAGRFRPGDKCHLFTGLRTDHCERLGVHTCLGVTPMLFTAYEGEHGVEINASANFRLYIKLGTMWLNSAQIEELAHRDTAGLWTVEQFVDFFCQTYILPFNADLIMW